MIFLRAEDPDGDMKSIAAVLWPAGAGFCPTQVNMLKAEGAKQFSGYLLMRSPTQPEVDTQGNDAASGRFTASASRHQVNSLAPVWTSSPKPRPDGVANIEIVCSRNIH